MTRRVTVVVGARPNFVKVAPVWHAARQVPGMELRLLHTGQHYDTVLSDRFLEDLDLPRPDVFLGAGGGTHAEQTAAVLLGVERYLAGEPADAVLVAGDVNSTLAAALAAAKLGVSVIHLESGLRSGDRQMPEEINRELTDHLADLLLCPTDEARERLQRESVSGDIAVVGNTMIDSLMQQLPAALKASPRESLGLERYGYVLVTLHRPSLVDEREPLAGALSALGELAHELPILLPLHPRTRGRMERWGIGPPPGVRTMEPLGYLEFIALEADARLVITDSGGVQEETTALGVPCLTYRTTTERPVTITRGTNALVGLDPERLRDMGRAVLAQPMPDDLDPIPLWDGAAGPRAARAIARCLGLAAPDSAVTEARAA